MKETFFFQSSKLIRRQLCLDKKTNFPSKEFKTTFLVNLHFVVSFTLKGKNTFLNVKVNQQNHKSSDFVLKDHGNPILCFISNKQGQCTDYFLN